MKTSVHKQPPTDHHVLSNLLPLDFHRSNRSHELLPFRYMCPFARLLKQSGPIADAS